MNKQDSERLIENLTKSTQLIQELAAVMPCPYTIERNNECIEALFDRFSPFKIGDIVEICTEIDFVEAPGWECCEHFLQVGCTGTVEDVSFYGKQFYVSVIMHDETFIHPHSKEKIKVSNPHLFSFSENNVRVIKRKE